MATVPVTNSASISLASIQQTSPQQQGVVIISMSPGGPNKLGIMKRTTRWLGISQLLCGALIMLGGVISANSRGVQEQRGARWTTTVGSAFWGGALMVAGGVIGIQSSRHQNSYKLNGVNMAFSIVGSLVGFINMAIFATGVAVFSSKCRYRRESEPSGVIYYKFCQRNQVGLGIHAVIMLLGLAEFIIGIVAAVLCCSALCQCCKQKKKLPAAQPLMTTPNSQPTIGTDQPIMLTSSSGQPIIMIPNQMPVHYSVAAGQPMMYPTSQQAMYMPQQPLVVYSQQNQQQGTSNTSLHQAQGAQTAQGAQWAQVDAPPEYQVSQDQTAEKQS